MTRTSTPKTTGRPHRLLTHHQLIGERLYIHACLRFLVAGTIVVGALFARFVVGLDTLDVVGLSVMAGLIAGYNVVVYLLVRYRRSPDRAAEVETRLLALRHITVIADYLALAGLVHLVGGIRSPFLAFFLLHVALDGIMLSRTTAAAHSAVAYGLLIGLALGEWLGWLPPRQPVGAVAGSGPIDGRYVLTVLVVYAILLSLTTFLLTGLADLLRQAEQRLRAANEHLDQLSQQRRDFLRVAMHNLKSPVSAVSMILTNLKNELPGPLNDKQKQMIDRSLFRLAGSNDFLRDVQTLANIESDDLTRQFQPIDLPRLLGELVEENRDLAEQREHALVLDLPDQPLHSPGIERLLREAIANFITNAIKYTPTGGRIVVQATAENDQVHVAVRDNGVGISEEDQARLFRDFVRIRSEHESVKDAPGSGLGLSIARRIIEAHGGTIHVDSQPDQGSTFTVTLPRA